MFTVNQANVIIGSMTRCLGYFSLFAHLEQRKLTQFQTQTKEYAFLTQAKAF